MRWQSESIWAKIDRKKQWHKWFAWYPVRLLAPDEHSNQYIDTEQKVWLEYVERRARYHHVTYWEHRAIISGLRNNDIQQGESV